MKELTAAFQSEVFRPVVSLVVPGFYSVSTLALLVWQRYPGIQKFAEDHPGLSATISVLVVLTAGLVTEDIGARVEYLLDRLIVRRSGYSAHRTEWFDYLRLAFDKEPVGHRYLRTIVLRLKFELGMLIASFPFAFFSYFLAVTRLWHICLFITPPIAAIYFGYEALTSSATLSELRREILKGNWNLSAQRSPEQPAIAAEGGAEAAAGVPAEEESADDRGDD